MWSPIEPNKLVTRQIILVGISAASEIPFCRKTSLVRLIFIKNDVFRGYRSGTFVKNGSIAFEKWLTEERC